MILKEEILKGATCPPEFKNNLLVLLERINKVRQAWGKPMLVTSGFRSREDQLRIYKAKGIPESKIPWGSSHLTCEAIDIYDPNGTLNAWCKTNEELLRSFGLWLEVRQGNWQHFQTKPFRSYTEKGTIFFNP